MAKKTPQRPVQPQRQQPVKPAQPVQVTKGMSPLVANLLSVAGILIFTFLWLRSALDAQFTNWDDPGYVTNNPLIKDFSSAGIANIFNLSNAVMGNYHPITILTLAWDYSKATLEPEHYHLTSLLFHLGTTALVYVFVWLLTKKRIAAIITAVLFGIHPMHIESVAWIAGRKDVVYGLFYMASCISYIYYIRLKGSMKWLWYMACAVLYFASLLSKPVAVVLPVSLMLIDFFEGNILLPRTDGQSLAKRINLTALLDKIPLFALSLWAGRQSLHDQHVFGALNTQSEKFNVLERIGLGAYALITYLWKLVVPVKLLCFYPYPLKENGHLPAVYYIYPVIAIALVGAAWWLFRRNKAVIFGVLFFLVNIALLLQFIPVGGAIVADRYSYIPYLGMFFMLGWGVQYLLDTNAGTGKAALGITAAYAMVLGYMSNERCKVWYDGMSLWRDVIEIEPKRAPNGYNNLGFFYFNKFNTSVNPAERKLYYDSSLYLLTKAIELQPAFVNPYVSLGELMRANNQFNESKYYYYKALTLDSTDMGANAYLGLSVIYSIGYNMTPKDNLAQLQFYNDSALFCYRKTLALKPYNPEAHSNYANFLDMTGRKEEALVEYGVSIKQNPDIYQPYLNRARAYQRMSRCDEAFKDFETAIRIEPKMGEIYYARAICYQQKGNTAAAQADLKKAQELGYRGPGQ